MAEINLKNIFHFMEGNFRMFYENVVGLPYHQREQIIYRAMTCKDDCLKIGACKACGCPVPDKFFQKDSCDALVWPALMELDNWEKYKLEKGIEIDKTLYKQFFT